MKHMTAVAGVDEGSHVLARGGCGISPGAGGGAAPSVLQAFCSVVYVQRGKSCCTEHFLGCSEQTEANDCLWGGLGVS